ncbi:MAG: HAD-IA family hydrolase [Leptolyngbyaceae cyanobacterium]
MTIEETAKKNQPRVIFLDAVGTLFGVKGNVGEIYREIALKFGVDTPAKLLNQSFFHSFKAASTPAFPGVDPDQLPDKEIAWWREVVTNTFKQAGAWQHFADFNDFFIDLYTHFMTAAPWEVYADVRPALERWNRMGIALGVLSNFDSRLYPVLAALGLNDYFASVTISTEVGAAKPDPKIFAIALEKHNCPPEWAWHVGDSFEEDAQAARVAGLHGIWLRRDQSLGQKA